MRDSLLESLNRRFKYIEEDDIFPISAMLTQSLGLDWCADDPAKSTVLIKLLKDKVTRFAILNNLQLRKSDSDVNVDNNQVQPDPMTEPASKKAKLSRLCSR